MYRYMLCIGICVFIWIINIRWIIHAVKEHITSEVYIHTGLSIFFTLLMLGIFKLWTQFDILWLQIIGLILYVPSAILVFGSMFGLKHKGKPDTSDPTATTTLVDTGVYRIVRQPMTLGMAIWSIALILVFQSILSVILGILSFFCFWMSARKEVEYNMKKFGDEYREYMKEVPIWNIFKRLRK